MSIDLVVAVPFNTTSAPQQIQDQNQNSTGLYLTSSTIGTTSLTSKGKLVFGLSSSGGGDGEWIQNTANGAQTGFGIAFYGDSKEWMRLTNSGQLGVGTTTPAATVDVAGTLNVSGGVSFPSLKALSGVDMVWSNGTVGIQTSSARFKDNIHELKEDFRKVLSLVPVSFNYKGSGQESFGYTAEEVHAKDLHHLVTYDEEGKPFSVNYKLLPIYLLEILKQQQEMIGRLEQKLASAFGFAPAPEPAAG
ncbi:MAG TPA: tail fiber domain-containing protein [Thermoanaerobaculia bacterium]|nr:tail fiber domain-containing protein [Thermoanaerobaculia bacterium]